MRYKKLIVLTLLAAMHGHAAASGPGSLDPFFGQGGKRTVPSVPVTAFSTDSKNVTASAIDPSGRIYLVGTALIDGVEDGIGIARLTPGGTIDQTFGTSGVQAVLPPSLDAVNVKDAVFDGQSRLLIAGQAKPSSETGYSEFSGYFVCRFDANAELDTTFGNEDLWPGCHVSLFEDSAAEAILVQACDPEDECVDGERIVVAGSYVIDGKRRGMISALNSDGSGYDVGVGGLIPVHGSITDPTGFHAIAQSPGGAVVAVGYRELGPGNRDFALMARTKDGQAFPNIGGIGGFRSITFDLGAAGYQRDEATAVHFSDDRILVAGRAQIGQETNRVAIYAMLTDGDPDPDFIGGGVQVYGLCSAHCNARVHDMLVLADGHIVLTGSIEDTGDANVTPINRHANFFALRLLSDGTPDPSFRSQDSDYPGLALVDFGGNGLFSEDIAYKALLQGEKLLISGYAQASDPLPDDGVDDQFDVAVARLDNSAPIFRDGFESQ